MVVHLESFLYKDNLNIGDNYYVFPSLIFSADRTADGKFISAQKQNDELTVAAGTFIINLTLQAAITSQLSGYQMCELETYLSLQIFCLDWQLAQRVLDLWLGTSTPSESHVHTQRCVLRHFVCLVF
jgi:hypothetical protein